VRACCFSNLFYLLNLFRACKRTQTATAQPLDILLPTGEKSVSPPLKTRRSHGRNIERHHRRQPLPKLLEQTGPRGNGRSLEIRSKLILVHNLLSERKTSRKPDVCFSIFSCYVTSTGKKLYFFSF